MKSNPGMVGWARTYKYAPALVKQVLYLPAKSSTLAVATIHAARDTGCILDCSLATAVLKDPRFKQYTQGRSLLVWLDFLNGLRCDQHGHLLYTWCLRRNWHQQALSVSINIPLFLTVNIKPVSGRCQDSIPIQSALFLP